MKLYRLRIVNLDRDQQGALVARLLERSKRMVLLDPKCSDDTFEGIVRFIKPRFPSTDADDIVQGICAVLGYPTTKGDKRAMVDAHSIQIDLIA